MPSFRTLGNKFFGNTISTAAGVAAGSATARALDPALQDLTNAAWEKHPTVPPDAFVLAVGVAQGQVDPAKAAAWAKQQGIGGEQFAALVDVANVGPGLGYAYDAWRRGLLGDAEFVTALKRQGLEDQWADALRGLKDVLLSPAELANARQQGYIDQARQLAEAEQQGIDGERAEIQFETVGLPPPQGEAQRLLNRGLIDDAQFAQMIREGHTKTKYIDVLNRAREAVLTATEYVNARVRGWITDGDMYAGGALTGHTREHMDLLFKIHGRPLSWHQIWIGLRRGGKYEGSVADLDPAFLKGLQESDIRPEWYNLAWAQRFNYPTAFVLRSLTTSGDITASEAEDVLLFEGWEPGFAHKVASSWAPSGTGKASTWVTRAEGYLFTATHKQYTPGPLYEAKARHAMTLIGIAADDQTRILELFLAETELASPPEPVPPVPGP